jgi:zinc-binding alcohol dehydrogenase/oxidoreductase
VIVTSSSAQKFAWACDLGAEAGVNYTEGDWAEEVRALTGSRGVDVVIDSIGSTWTTRCGACGEADDSSCSVPPPEINARQVYFGQVSLLGTTMGGPREFADLLELIGRDAWRPVLDSVRPLPEASTAHERMEAGAQFGKLVLEIA